MWILEIDGCGEINHIDYRQQGENSKGPQPFTMKLRKNQFIRHHTRMPKFRG